MAKQNSNSNKKEDNIDQYFAPYKKSISKWITDLNIKYKTIKPIGKNTVKKMKRKLGVGGNRMKMGEMFEQTFHKKRKQNTERRQISI